MSYGQVTDLAIIGIENPSVANQERILLRPTQVVDLQDFLLLIGPITPQSTIRTQMAPWLGPSQVVQPPAWILIYTGSGTNRSEVSSTGEILHIRYLGYPKTIFFTGIGVALVRIAALSVGNPVK